MSAPAGPRVSVVIPAYRVTDYIAQALDSVFAQTFPPHEVIVVNDECPDTAALEVELAPYRDRIVYITRPNGGPGAARNTGIRSASGELIAFLDADDYWRPEFLEQQVRLLEAGDRDLVYSDAVYVDDQGTTVGSLMERAPSHGEPDLEGLLRGRCTVATSTVLARREMLEAAGLFDEEIGNYSEDFDLWCRVAYTGGRIDYQRRQLAVHRVHGESLTASKLALPRGALRVLRKIRRTMRLTAEQGRALAELEGTISSAVLTEEAKEAILGGEFRVARDKLRGSLSARPTAKRWAVLLALSLMPRLVRWVFERRQSKPESAAAPGKAGGRSEA